MITAKDIFSIASHKEFESITWKVFGFQYQNNSVYRKFCDLLGKTPEQLPKIGEIPFLPIDFFKTKVVVSSHKKPDVVFESSGTTGKTPSKHCVTDLSLYKESYLKAFQNFYGRISDYCILALLPSYLERNGSSLIYMAQDLIHKSKHPDSGFYLNDLKALTKKLVKLDGEGTKILLLGVSFALLDLVENHRFSLRNTVVMETGGMKGRRKELVRPALHDILKKGFGVTHIHSEYGMTELLSQAYSKGDGIFRTPPWMKVLARDTEDPLALQRNGKTGGLNIIDLANLNSCCFIATQDLGKVYGDGSFEVLGRFDHSDIRGCNLMVL